MSAAKKIVNRNRRETQTFRTIKMRAHLNADALFAIIRKDLQPVPDHRAPNASIPLDDMLMSTFAMFSLKDPSLLAFDDRRHNEPESLHGVFGVGVIPSDDHPEQCHGDYALRSRPLADRE